MGEVVVFDKAKWHSEGNYPAGIPKENALNHIGYFLAWMADRNMMSEQFKDDFSSELEDYRSGKITGPQLLGILDGVIDSEMFTDEGNRFAKYYYDDFYLSDYERVFPKVNTLYEVSDTKDNFQTISKEISKAFAKWKSAE